MIVNPLEKGGIEMSLPSGGLLESKSSIGLFISLFFGSSYSQTNLCPWYGIDDSSGVPSK